MTLGSYAGYTQRIYHLLADRASVASHTLAVFTVNRTVGIVRGPEVQSTHPYHRHVPPDIKHHRVPAPEISFSRPNLPTLLALIEQRITPP